VFDIVDARYKYEDSNNELKLFGLRFQRQVLYFSYSDVHKFSDFRV
jgi:hypothetical protein